MIALALTVAAGAVACVSDRWAPLALVIALLPGFHRLQSAWRGAEGTSLRPSVAWFFVTWVVGLLSQFIAMTEESSTGRPWTGHWVYVDSLFALAGAVSLLNARRPGADAWAILTLLLVGIFLIPWMEGSGLVRNAPPLARLRLESPWSIFYGLVAGCSVANFVATGFGAAAICLGIGWVAVLVGLAGVRSPDFLAHVWSVWGLTLALALAVAGTPFRGARGTAAVDCAANRLWVWFRDRWGLVWALRIQDRFNTTAHALGWPVRLGWSGMRGATGAPATPEEVPTDAVRTLIALLGRFARRSRLECESGLNQPSAPAGHAVATNDGPACQARDGG